MKTLAIPANVELAPYSQLMQELLDGRSMLSQNTRGIAACLLRFEDWIPHRVFSESVQQIRSHIQRLKIDFIAALAVFRRRTSSAIFVFLCPSSNTLDANCGRMLEGIHSDLLSELSAIENVHCWSHSDIVRLYHITTFEDPAADRLGHIPYTNDYFVAIATLFARRIASLRKPPYKVIVLDCDDTLWGGLCAEEGPLGVALTPAHLAFQKMLVHQHEMGMLLCLCSKNQKEDVEAVFRARSDMPLRKEHLLSCRVNWDSKPLNLRSLSEELNLSLESFIFIDDSPFECAQVRSQHPSVLTLQFPRAQDEVATLIDHIWAFDRINVTEEAKRRNSQYKDDQARRNSRENASCLRDFLDSLDLKVDSSLMARNQLLRVTELIQRTNQFNLTGIRRTASEIEVLERSGNFKVLVTHVQDRFGDYGLVAAVILRRAHTTMEVDTFVLSCRALGRGVEHRIVNEIGRIARNDGLSTIILTYQTTSRNRPACEFLDRSFGQFRLSRDAALPDAKTVFSVPAEYAEHMTIDVSNWREDGVEISPGRPPTQPESHEIARWHEEAFRLKTIPDIVKEMGNSLPRQRKPRQAHALPDTRTESALVEIWSEVLGIESLHVDDDLFQLGADSVHVVRALSRVASTFGVELTLTSVFDASTVRRLSVLLEAERRAQASRDAVSMAGIKHDLQYDISTMSEAEILKQIATLEGDLTTNLNGKRRTID